MKRPIENLINIVITVTTVCAISVYFYGKADALGSAGTNCFRYYTTDSNVLAAVSAGLCLVFSFRKRLPHAVEVFRFISTVAVLITFFTTTFFLTPNAALSGRGMSAITAYFGGNVFVLHLSTPVLSLISLLISEHDFTISRKECLWGISTVVIYSVVYVYMVVIAKEWRDWYGFTFGGKTQFVPIVVLVMYSFAAVLSLLLHLVNRKVSGRAKN